MSSTQHAHPDVRPIQLSPSDRPRVLVVDDEPHTRCILAAFLTSAGMDVVRAESGERALELLERGRFETVVSDLRMPGIDGFSLLRAARERDADLPVVVVTGCPAPDARSDALELGAIDLLVKPVSANLLIRTVRMSTRLCSLARLSRRAAEPLAFEPAPTPGPGVPAAFQRALSTLYLAWQPIVCPGGGPAWGREAFARTLEPTLSAPEALFSAAERLDRLRELGRTLRRISATELEPFGAETVFVNIHPSELDDDELLDAASPLSRVSRSVVLELTDRTPLESVSGLRGRIRTLRALGYRIGVERVGPEPSRLNRLSLVEPDFVKLSSSVIRDLDGDPERQRIAASMTKAFHDLGIRVVATGIETMGEQAAAEEAGVDFLQGFLFGRPKPLGIHDAGASPFFARAAAAPAGHGVH